MNIINDIYFYDNTDLNDRKFLNGNELNTKKPTGNDRSLKATDCKKKLKISLKGKKKPFSFLVPRMDSSVHTCIDNDTNFSIFSFKCLFKNYTLTT